MNENDTTKQKCKFCQIFSKYINFNDLSKNKYYDSFNFYLAKPINEIMNNAPLPHVIYFKDLHFFDEDRSYFNVFFSKSFQNFKEILSNSKQYHPNLVIFHDLKPIKSRYKKKNTKEINENDTKSKNSEKIDLFLEKFGSEISENMKENIENEDFFGLENENELNFNADSNPENPLKYIKQTRVKLADQRLNKSGSFLKDLERQMEELSFESVEFNIYDPKYSSSGHSREDSLDLEKKKSLQQQKLNNLNEKIAENVFEFEFIETDSENENGNKGNSQEKNPTLESFRSKKNYAKGGSQSNGEKEFPIFVIKKNLMTKTRESNKDQAKILQIQAEMRRNNNNGNQLRYKSMNSNPLLFSSSFSNVNVSAKATERNLEEEGEIEGRKKMGLKEKIMEMNRIYNKKPNYTNKALIFKDK